MKKIIITIGLLSMLGWTVYQFVFSSNAIGNDDDGLEELVDDQNQNEQNSPDSDIKIGLDIGDRAPDFELTTLKGDVVSLSDYEGSPVMINFWATWCPPCREEMPDMEKFYQETEIEILAVNLLDTERTIDDVEQFVEEYGLTFPILLDESIEVAMIYGIQSIPTSYMIDSEGIIQFIVIGPLTYQQMNQELDNIN